MLRVFNRALTKDEIDQLYSEGGTPMIGQYTMDNISGHTSWESREQTIFLPDTGTLVIGDFTMSGKEFKSCMEILRKINMKEHPEEYI